MVDAQGAAPGGGAPDRHASVTRDAGRLGPRHQDPPNGTGPLVLATVQVRFARSLADLGARVFRPAGSEAVLRPSQRRVFTGRTPTGHPDR